MEKFNIMACNAPTKNCLSVRYEKGGKSQGKALNVK